MDKILERLYNIDHMLEDRHEDIREEIQHLEATIQIIEKLRAYFVESNLLFGRHAKEYTWSIQHQC